MLPSVNPVARRTALAMIQALALGTVAALLALVVPTPLAAQTAPRAPGGNWSTTFAQTPHGHRVGNPQADLSLISFVSYSCPHCATFEKQAELPLQAGYIRTGKVSLEVRHVIRNPLDLAAALATECGPPERFFARHRTMMTGHEAWMSKAMAATPAQQQRWSTGPLGQRMRAIASDLDFYQLMARHDLTTAALDRCLGDEARARAIVTNAQEDGEQFAIAGTPSFALNGKLLPDVHGWTQLKALLDARS